MEAVLSLAQWAALLGLIGLAVAVFLYTRLLREPVTGGQPDSLLYSRRRYASLIIFLLVVAALLWLGLGLGTVIGYLSGAVCALIYLYFASLVTFRVKIRLTHADGADASREFQIAQRGAVAVGLGLAGVALIGTGIWYFVLGSQAIAEVDFLKFASTLAAFALGASCVALFERYLTVDVGLVGVNTFDSFIGATAASIALGVTSPLYEHSRPAAIALPMLIGIVGLVASFVTTAGARLFGRATPLVALRNLHMVATAIFLVITYGVVDLLNFTMAPTTSARSYIETGPFWAIAAGAVAGILIVFVSQYYATRPAASDRLAFGMQSAVAITAILAVAILIADQFAGMYGVAVAATGMLATVTAAMSLRSYGGIAIPARNDKATVVGNSFAIGAAALAAISLYAAYAWAVGLRDNGLLITAPVILVGALIGAAIPFLIASWTISPNPRRVFVPELLTLVGPVVAGYFSINVLGGFLAGAAISGVLIALTLTASSDRENVGANFIAIAIKTMCLIALVLAPVFLKAKT